MTIAFAVRFPSHRTSTSTDTKSTSSCIRRDVLCRRSKVCSELGAEPTLWSTECPLPHPDWASNILDEFSRADVSARHGDKSAAKSALDRIRDDSDALREWFDVHAQNTGRFRFEQFGESPRPPVHRVGSRYISAALTREVAERDGYHCRYCAQRVVPHSVFRRFRALVGPDAFPTGRSNATRHGVRLVFGMSIDHVVPHSHDGETTLANLVTACWPCNFGKADFLLSELGLGDPRSRGPVTSNWRGLLH